MEQGERRFAKALRVRVSRGLYDHIDKLATDLCVSRSEVLRDAIRRGVVVLKRQHSLQWRSDRRGLRPGRGA